LEPLAFVVFTTRQGLWICEVNSCSTSGRDRKGCWWSRASRATSNTNR